MDFFDLASADAANVFDLRFGSGAGGGFGLGCAPGCVNLLLRRAADLLDLILGFLAGHLGRLAHRGVALGRAPLSHFGGLLLEGSGQLAAQGRDNALDRGFEVLIGCHGASSDYTAHSDNSLTLLVLFVKGAWPQSDGFRAGARVRLDLRSWCPALDRRSFSGGG